MKYSFKYADNMDRQGLIIKINVEGVFNNPEFDFEGDESREIYQLLTSDNKKEIQEFLEDCLQDDDSPYRRGEN
tara:strand:- start:979 stop:1200 length:222 start_codon:yes stop_codon:yes gene_type:complete